MYEIILAGFKFGDFPQSRQFVKLKTSPKFPAIRYIDVCVWNLDWVHVQEKEWKKNVDIALYPGSSQLFNTAKIGEHGDEANVDRCTSIHVTTHICFSPVKAPPEVWKEHPAIILVQSTSSIKVNINRGSLARSPLQPGQ